MDPWGLTTSVLLACVLLLIFLSQWSQGLKKGKLPPGPTPLPFLSNLLQLDLKNITASFSQCSVAEVSALTEEVVRVVLPGLMCEKLGCKYSYLKLTEKYGPIYTLYFGSQRIVVLHGYKIMKEALIDQGDGFVDRGNVPIFEDVFKRKPTDPTFILGCAPCNVICSILFHDRFKSNDEKFLYLMKLLNENFQLFNSRWAQLYNFLPRFRVYLPGKHKKVFLNVEEMQHFILERVKEHQKILDPTNPQDFIDCYLSKMQQIIPSLNLTWIVMTGANLFVAGTETTSSTLRYGLLLILKHPEVQAKIHEEIDRVIGHNRAPSIKDRQDMPYLDAVIHEVQRLLTSSLNLSHSVTQDIQLQQYFLPKGTTIFPLLFPVLFDSKEFPNPEQFDPQRFLDKNGKFKKSDYFMPFSIGKKSCLGEGLARMELFLFFTTILQNFTLKSVGDPNEISIKTKKVAFTNLPPFYKLCFPPR